MTISLNADVAVAHTSNVASWSNLSSLVAPMSGTLFLSDYWKRKPLFVPASEERLASVVKDLGSLQVETLLTQHQWLDIWREQPISRPLPETSRSIDLALDAYYNQGATLYFHLRRDVPLFRSALQLAHQLGESRALLRASMFAVRAHHGSEPHYDRNDNITIQLRGRKKWVVAPNEFIEEPVANWVMSSPPPAYCDRSRIPTTMPANAAEWVLTPGSVLYVPRGFLHHVTALDADSLSVVFAFGNLLVGEAIGAAFQRQMFASVAFRRAITGLFGAEWNASAARSEIAAAIAEYKRLVQTISETTVLDDILRSK